jgi:hypothetical protein
VSRALATVLALLLLLATALPVAATTPSRRRPPAGGEVVPGEVVVKWRDAARGLEVAVASGSRSSPSSAHPAPACRR